MIEEAWNEYRGWAKRARSLQRSTRQWNRAALVCGSLVAIFGAAASQVPDGLLFGKAMAFMAAVLAAITPVLGREILSVGGEAQWIRARATAEAIKSECFRFAAQLGDYAGSSAKDVFVARRNALTEPAERAGLTPLHDPVPTTGDARRPPNSTHRSLVHGKSSRRASSILCERPERKRGGCCTTSNDRVRISRYCRRTWRGSFKLRTRTICFMDRRDDDDSRDYHGLRTVGSTSVLGGHIRCHGNATLADQRSVLERNGKFFCPRKYSRGSVAG